MHCLICGKAGYIANEGVSFHKFPKGRADDWLKFFNLDSKSVNVKIEYSRLCSRHFAPEDFYTVGDGPKNRRLMRKDAVPSILHLDEETLNQRKLHFQQLGESNSTPTSESLFKIDLSKSILTPRIRYPRTCLLCGKQNNVTLSFFRFPKDEDRKKVWMEACNLKVPITISSRLCSRHFQEDQFSNISKYYGHSFLKPTAIPTIFFPENRISDTISTSENIVEVTIPPSPTRELGEKLENVATTGKANGTSRRKLCYFGDKKTVLRFRSIVFKQRRRILKLVKQVRYLKKDMEYLQDAVDHLDRKSRLNSSVGELYSLVI